MNPVELSQESKMTEMTKNILDSGHGDDCVQYCVLIIVVDV